MKRLFLFVAGLFALFSVAVAAAAWRLTDGPISAPALRPAVEKALGGAGEVFVDDVLVGWGAEGFGPDVRLRGVAILRDGALIAEAPELVVGFTLADILAGGFEPTGIRIVGAALRLTIDADGGVQAALGDGDGAPIAVGGATSGGAGGFGRIAFDDAQIVVDARALGVSEPFAATGVRAQFAEAESGFVADAAFTLSIDGRPIAVAAEGALGADGVARLSLASPAAPAAAFAALDPALAPLARYDGVAVLDLAAQLDTAAQRLMRGAADIRLTPGRWRPADDAPLIELLDGVAALTVSDLDLAAIRRDPQVALNGASLDAEARVSVAGDGDTRLPLSLRATRTPDADATRLSVAAQTSSFAGAVDILAAQAASFGFPLSTPPPLRLVAPGALTIDGVIGDDGALRTAALSLQADEGRLEIPAIYPDAPLALAEAKIALAYDADDRAVVLDPSSLRLAPLSPGGLSPMMQASGGVTPAAEGGRRVAFSLSGDRFDIAHYQALWPYMPGNTARSWMAERMRSGVISNLNGAFAVHVDDDGGVTLERSEAFFDVEGLSLIAKPGLDPIDDLSGRGTIDGLSLEIAVTGGVQNGVMITGGSVAFPDFGADPVRIVIDGTLDGPVASVLTTLDSPALGYPSQIGLTPSAASGRAEGRLRLAFPLLRDLTFADVELAAQAELSAFGLRDAVGAADLSRATATLDVDLERLTLGGRGRLAGAPVEFNWREGFADAPDSRVIVASGVLDDAVLAAIGVDPPPERFAGAVGADVRLTAGRGAPSRIRADLDLREAALAVDEIGWSKPAGAPATAQAEVLIGENRLLNAPTLALSAPGLSFAGSYAPGGAPDAGRVTASSLRFGRTAFDQLDVRFDEEKIVLLGRAAALDLAPLREADLAGEEESGGDAIERNPVNVSFTAPVAIDARLAVDRLWIDAETPPMTDVALRLSHDGADWRTARFDGRTGEGSLAFDYAAGRDGADLALRIEDVGDAVAAFGGPQRVRGGRLAATAEPAAEGGVAGRVDVKNLRLVNAPIMTKALQIASLTGILESLAGSGLLFSSLGADWRLKDGVLSLANGKGSNTSLGWTFEGDVDLTKERIAMRGTLAPAYLLSRVVGAIPLIGDLLSPRDEGLFAFSYQAVGPMEDPEVSVNPLTALAPGVLRDLFPNATPQDAAN